MKIKLRKTEFYSNKEKKRKGKKKIKKDKTLTKQKNELYPILFFLKSQVIVKVFITYELLLFLGFIFSLEKERDWERGGRVFNIYRKNKQTNKTIPQFLFSLILFE